ncbi:MAG: ion channel [Candidatus Nanohaloarchaea archaeon]|nr:ion channel [Candidatus Nanohaloarchaea archaeon]
MAQTCSFTFPDDCDHDVPEDDIEEWNCGHECFEDRERCIFHLSPDEREEAGIEPSHLKNLILQRIDSRGEKPKQFIGATFRDLDLEHVVLQAPDNHPIDLRHVHIEGSMDISHSDIRQPFVLEGARIDGFFKAIKAEFESYASFRDTVFQSHLNCSDVVFKGPVHFRNTVFDGAGTNPSYEAFVASFSGSRFEEKSVFDYAEFRGRVDFRDSVIENATFHYATLDVVFLGGSVVQKIAVTASRAFNDFAYLSFVGSRINGGVLNQPYIVEDGEVQYPDEAIYYNFSKAHVGPVKLKPDEEGNLFRYFYIHETEFESFDFTNYETFLEPDWRLHEYMGPLLREGHIRGSFEFDRSLDPSQLEITYLKARKGAEATGAAKARSEFFNRQMWARRQKHIQVLQDNSERVLSRLLAGINYVSNFTLGLISGHGEKPQRVVATSVAVILICALLFPLVGGIQVSGTEQVVRYGAEGSSLIETLGRSLYFSTTTFTTLGVGDLYPAGIYTQILSGLESLAGALLMALLVFVLGRRA